LTAEPAVLAIRGGQVIDAGGCRLSDVLLRGELIEAVGPGLDVPAGARVLDAGGCVVAPGLVDLHTHLRQPGREEAECVETGARAAALGGYTAVVAMPNTEPALDCAGAVRQVLDLGLSAMVDVSVAGAISVGRQGERLAPMAEMAALGVRTFTDDGDGVQDARLMRRAFEYSLPLGVTLAQHCEDSSLAAGSQMHEGEWSARLGLPGQPGLAEELMAWRDMALARLTGGRLHLLHLSTAASMELVRAAKADGVAVTAEVTPHHLCLSDAAVAGYDAAFKVNPPLREPSDVAALRGALANGAIDAIATDHAPHGPEAKEAPFDRAAPGMIGLETALGVILTELSSDLSLATILGLLSWQPASIAGLAAHGGPVAAGAVANLCVIDPATTWTVDPAQGASRSRNTPFAGKRLTGRLRHTVYRGEPVVIDAEPQR